MTDKEKKKLTRLIFVMNRLKDYELEGIIHIATEILEKRKEGDKK